MTRFEKDYHEMLKGAGLYILQGRRAEIQKLKKAQRALQEPLPVPVHLPGTQPAGTGIRSP